MGALNIVVVGAGTLGLSSALHLAERGVAVTVSEALAIAGVSTGRSLGVVGIQHVTALDVDLRAYGVRRIRAWRERGLECHAIGYLRLGRSAGDLELFDRSLGFQRDAGIDSARILDPVEIQALVPDMSTDGLAGGLFGPDDGFLDPHRLSILLAEMVRELGGTVRQRCRLLGADRLGAGYRLATSAGAIDCDGVVIAAGAWAGPAAKLFGKSLPVLPARHAAVAVPPAPPPSLVVAAGVDFGYGGGGAR